MHTYPSVPELDFAGRVVGLCPSNGKVVAAEEQEEEEGEEGEEKFRVGDLVFGSIPISQHLKGSGALAEYVAISTTSLSHIPTLSNHSPTSISQQLAAAASLPVSGCTALCLFKAAKIEEGMHILINGASGGVGSLILQMAKHAVGEIGSVTAVCSQRNRKFVRTLGADEVVAYDGLDMPVVVSLQDACNERARELAVAGGRILGRSGRTGDDGEELTKEEIEAGKFDVVIDAVGKQDMWYSCPSFLKTRGVYVTVGPGMEGWTRVALLKTLGQMVGNWLTPAWLGGVERRYVQVASTVDKKGLMELKGLVDEEVVRGLAGSVWGWEDIGEAYEVMLSRRARGKIVIKVEQ